MKKSIFWIVVAIWMAFFIMMATSGCGDSITNSTSTVSNSYNSDTLVFSLDEFMIEDYSSGGELYDGFFYQFEDAGTMKMSFYGETNWDIADFVCTVHDNGISYFSYERSGNEVNGEHAFAVDYVNLSTVEVTLHLQSFARVYKYIKLYTIKIYKIN